MKKPRIIELGSLTESEMWAQLAADTDPIVNQLFLIVSAAVPAPVFRLRGD